MVGLGKVVEARVGDENMMDDMIAGDLNHFSNDGLCYTSV